MKTKDLNNFLSPNKVGIANQSSILFSLLLLLFSLIGARLFWLQVYKGSFYKKLSDENRIRLVASPPIRGRLLDRNGNLLATNKLSYSLSIQPRLVTEERWPLLRDDLVEVLNIPKESLDRAFYNKRSGDSYRIFLARGLSNENVLRFKEQERNLIGAQIDLELVRHYPNKSLAAHALGYTQPITPEELADGSHRGYKLIDRIGRKGIEAAYEQDLRGSWGGEMLEVDSTGEVQRSLGLKPPEAGKDLTLTIDINLQRTAEKVLLDKRAGAIVALDPRTGAVRAMASKPTYDPNFFSKPIRTQDEYESLFNSSLLPLLSRAINAYDPGSTWKPVTAMAGMESNQFPPETILNTTSCIKYGSHCFPEYNRRGWGRIGYEDALRVSSNTFFYQVGVGVGSNHLYSAGKKLGFDSLTGIEFSREENRGLVGNKEWADKGREWGKPGETPWIPEDMASASIGQSVVLVTPLQLARAYAAFSNGGYLVTPHFVKGDKDWLSPKFRKKIQINKSTLDTIRKGLRKVVTGGTGKKINYRLPELPPVAGKSGTAEDSSGGSDHAWFVCFAPYESAELVVVAFAQNTPGGGAVHALPMAREMLKTWNALRLED